MKRFRACLESAVVGESDWMRDVLSLHVLRYTLHVHSSFRSTSQAYAVHREGRQPDEGSDCIVHRTSPSPSEFPFANDSSWLRVRVNRMGSMYCKMYVPQLNHSTVALSFFATMSSACSRLLNDEVQRVLVKMSLS